MTNKEIAAKLNISPASLSLIINNRPGVSDQTRARVIAELEKMGYNDRVKSKRTSGVQNLNSQGNIGYVIYKKHGIFIDNHPFFILLLEEIERRARERGYGMLLITLDGRNSLEEQKITLKNTRADGYIFFACEMDNLDIALFKDLDRPYIVLDNIFSMYDVNAVAINNALGMYQAIEYLRRLGHRNIGYLKCKISTNGLNNRFQSYCRAMVHFGEKPDPNMVFKLSFTEEGSYQDFKEYLEEGRELPSAFVADDDTIALGVIRALQEKQVKIPEEISIMGFNDRPSCVNAVPALTTIRVLYGDFCNTAVDLIVKNLQSEEKLPSLQICVGTKLMERNSTAVYTDAQTSQKENQLTACQNPASVPTL